MLIGGQAMEDIEWVLGLKTSRRNGNTYSKSRILSRIDSILKKLYLKKFLKIFRRSFYFRELRWNASEHYRDIW